MRLANYFTERPWRIFAGLWLLLFILYLPAAHSGMVGDSIGWLESIRKDSFWDYLNRTRYGSAHSFYQFTLFINWVCYQLWGVHAWGWHLLSLTVHAVNAYLLYLFTSRLFKDARLKQGNTLALCAVVVYALSPYHVEAIVWEASYHYLQGFMIILIILLLAQRCLHDFKPALAIWAGLLYLLSIFSLEIFYLTPLFVFTLALFYRMALGYSQKSLFNLILFFCLPQLLLLAFHFGLFLMVYGHEVPHVGADIRRMNAGYFATRPPEYLFHLLWGRFFPDAFRHRVHALVMTYPFAAFFYGSLIGIGIYLLLRFRRLDAKVKTIGLFYLWMLFSVSILLPLWFPGVLLSVSDRYLYLLAAFYFTGITLLVSKLKSDRLKTGLWLIAVSLNIFFTVRLCNYWGLSTRMIDALETDVPVQPGKVILMLNSPASYKGIAMIGCTQESEFKLVNELLHGNTIPNRMTDVLGYNLAATDDGAYVKVLNDSTVQVNVKHRDINFWFGGTDGVHLETPFYKITDQDTGLWYRLILKGDPARYQLLYQTGMRLKTVDMNQKEHTQY